MTTFWLVAALMMVLILVLAVAPVMMRGRALDAGLARRREENLAAYRQQLAALEAEQLPAQAFEQARAELDRTLLADMSAGDAGEEERALDAGRGAGVLVLAVAVMLVGAIVGYRQLGAAQQMQINQQLLSLSETENEQQRVALALELIPALQNVAGTDESGGYRFLLARFFMNLQRYPEAASEYAQLSQMYPDDAAIMAQYAQALYVANDSTMTPEVQSLIERASAIDPTQVTLLGMLGMEQFKRGDFAGAVRSWQRLLPQLDPASQDAQIIQDGIAMAMQNLSEEEAAALADGQTGADELAPVYEVNVSLAEGIDVPEDAMVFVFATAASGPPMPLAVQRFSVQELPRSVSLSDANAMMPSMKITKFQQIKLTARVSMSGQPVAQPGDIEGGGDLFDVEAGTHSVNIVIDRQI